VQMVAWGELILWTGEQKFTEILTVTDFVSDSSFQYSCSNVGSKFPSVFLYARVAR